MPDPIAAPAPLSIHGIRPEGLIARAVDWIFGYNFFISYSHGDGMRLPRRIKERLEQAGFRVFLDQTEYWMLSYPKDRPKISGRRRSTNPICQVHVSLPAP
jgi:hypothetical protein